MLACGKTIREQPSGQVTDRTHRRYRQTSPEQPLRVREREGLREKRAFNINIGYGSGEGGGWGEEEREGGGMEEWVYRRVRVAGAGDEEC